MSFTVTYTGGFNPFEWNELKCPVCGASAFVSQDHAMVFCDMCYAQFEVRHTAGDPGCVVDCIIGEELLAPVWECADCGEEATFFDWQKAMCPKNSWHTMRKADPDGRIRNVWNPPEGYPKRFCLILKLGDYCSGWLDADSVERLNHPTQEQWDKFQAERGIAWPRHGARWAIL